VREDRKNKKQYTESWRMLEETAEASSK
jgi:hypothetical protein